MASEPPQLTPAGRFELLAYHFAETLSDTVQSVAGESCRRFSAVVTLDPPDAYVSQDERAGIPLTRAGITILRLEVTIKLTLDHSGEFLRVQKSQMRVYPEGGSLPVFRYEYEEAKESGPLPAAHFQVHGRHPDLEGLMSAAGRLKSRSSGGSGIPNVADLHFPVGGTRFRPCLEDVLEMLIQEFRVDPLPDKETALLALAAGRQDWRERQLRTSIRDNPAVAVDQVRRLGYSVGWEKDDPEPGRRDEHIRSL